jgi:hypothetical protein
MDPNASLEEMRSLALRSVDSEDDDQARLAELVLAIDGWLSNGGFLPKRWKVEQV